MAGLVLDQFARELSRHEPKIRYSARSGGVVVVSFRCGGWRGDTVDEWWEHLAMAAVVFLKRHQSYFEDE